MASAAERAWEREGRRAQQAGLGNLERRGYSKLRVRAERKEGMRAYGAPLLFDDADNIHKFDL
jgi:hypothetical protein